MSTRNFDLTVQAEGVYMGRREWTGAEMHSVWGLENINESSRGTWSTSSSGWMQLINTPTDYSLRYNALDLENTETDFETLMSPGGTLNYEFGVMFCYTNRNSFYFLAFNGGYQNWGGNNIRLRKKTGTTYRTIAEIPYPVFTNAKEYKIAVKTIGSRIQIWLDDALIIDVIDNSAPLTKGAFGPIAKGQQFARWKYFKAISNSSFSATEKEMNIPIGDAFGTAIGSKLLSPKSVGDYMKAATDAVLASVSLISYHYTRFILASSNPRISVIFNKTDGVRVSTDPKDMMFAYQTLPTVPPKQATKLVGMALSETEIRYTWEHDGEDVGGFYLVDETGAIIATISASDRSYVEGSLEEYTTYKRQIVAFNVAGKASASNMVAITTLHYAPDAPQDFKGTALNHESIKWTWTDTFNKEFHYELIDYSSGSEVIIAVIPADTTSYVETGLTQLTTYTRHIRVVNSRGNSPLSAEASATTTELLPDPPKYAPYNFQGVGIAHDTIKWGWQDKNDDATGFAFFSKEGRELFRVSYINMYYETGLKSEMIYARYIAAYNRGGVGPMSDLASAKTLPYGYGTGEAPTAPLNLYAHNVTETSVNLNWEYIHSPLLEHEGFKIYLVDETLMHVIVGSSTSAVLNDLEPNTVYTVYVVAYNQYGESMSSNEASFMTLAPPEEEPSIDDSLDSDTLSELDGVEYEYETEETEKIRAFHAGVGDGLDLIVHNLASLYDAEEEFNLKARIHGVYEVEVIDYPEQKVKFRIKASGRTFSGNSFVKYSDWIEQTVQDGEVPKIYNGVVHIPDIPDDANIKASSFSIEVKDEFGSTISNGTDSLFWTHDVREMPENIGYQNTITMSDIFHQWTPYTQGSAHWIHSTDTGELIMPDHLQTDQAIFSPIQYRKYDITMRLRSDGVDNDEMGFVLAKYTDSSGDMHTLSAIRGATTSRKWRISYQKNMGTETVLTYLNPDSFTSRNWSTFYPAGAKIRVIRDGDIIRAYTSLIGSSDIDNSLMLELDLNDHPKTIQFKGAQQIGVYTRSQPNARYYVESFFGEKVVKRYNNVVTIWTKKSTTKAVHEKWMGQEIIVGTYTVKDNLQQIINAQIQMPFYQASWKEIADKYDFVPTLYSISIISDNPNVRLELLERPDDMTDPNKLYLPFKVGARIINKEQTPWSPHIHNGYYYLNHQEHFLYSETDVRAELNSDIELSQYTFPYEIKVVTERSHDAGNFFVEHTKASEFMSGDYDANIEISFAEDTLSISPHALEGQYISPVVSFPSMINDWNPTYITGDYVDEVEIELAHLDSFGQVVGWYPIAGAPAMDKTKYRLKMKPYKVTTDWEEQIDTNSLLANGVTSYTEVVNDEVHIKDPLNNMGGTYITEKLQFTHTVANLKELRIDMNVPAGATVTVYTATSDSPTHDYQIPTAEHPWIPATLLSISGSTYHFKPGSVPKMYTAIIIEMMRGDDKTSPVVRNIILDADTKEYEYFTPKIDSIFFGGDMGKGLIIEEYNIPMIGTVLSDGAFHDITKEVVEDVVTNYLFEMGITVTSTIKEYLYIIDPALPVELKGDYLGKIPLQARTSANVGEVIYKQKDIILNNGRAIIRPIPQNGKPIVVYNAQGVLMRQVHNRDENMKPTLDFTEFHTTNRHKYIFLRNLHHHIDIRTVIVSIKINGKWQVITDASIYQNRISLPLKYKEGLEVKVKYKLHNSYVVDYNYDTEKDYALITAHMDYNEDVEETKVLTVFYETNKVHPYYIAEEINMNPLFGKESKGFIYLVDELKKAEKLRLRLDYSSTATKKEKTIVHAYLTDEDGNPVVGEPIYIRASAGTLMANQLVTDANGLAIYTFDSAGVTDAKVKLSAEHNVSSTKVLTKEETIQVKQELYGSNIVIVPKTNEFEIGDSISIEVKTVGENFEPRQNIDITLTCTGGTVSPSNITTDYVGKATVTFTHSGNASDVRAMISVTDTVNKEGIILGVKEV